MEIAKLNETCLELSIVYVINKFNIFKYDIGSREIKVFIIKICRTLFKFDNLFLILLKHGNKIFQCLPLV